MATSQLSFPWQDLAREKLAQLRGQLEKLTRKGRVPSSSEAEGDLKSRLQRARQLEGKICARKTAREEKERLSHLSATQEPKPEAEDR